MRFHGLQAIAIGTIWAVAAYVASWLAPFLTLAVFVVGTLVWLTLMLAALFGRDLRLPGSAVFTRLAEASARDTGSA